MKSKDTVKIEEHTKVCIDVGRHYKSLADETRRKEMEEYNARFSIYNDLANKTATKEADAPDYVYLKQLRELSIKTDIEEK